MTTHDELIERLRARDRDAFAAMHAEVGALLFAFAMTLTRDPDRAADLVQDAYVVALRNIESFKGQSSLRTWLCGIMVNKAREQRRKGAREVPESVLPEDVVARFATDGRWNEPPVPWEDPARRMDRTALASAARAEMESLGETARTVMKMCDIDGFTPIEAAEVLGLTNGNVRVILHRARAVVRQRLEERFARGRATGAARDGAPADLDGGVDGIARFAGLRCAESGSAAPADVWRQTLSAVAALVHRVFGGAAALAGCGSEV